jgi:hypothetical protein
VLSSSIEVSSSSDAIDPILESVNPSSFKQNSHFATLKLSQNQTVLVVSPSGRLLFNEELKAGAHTLEAGRFPNKVLIRK